MAHFYGTIQGNRGEATRCGAKSSGLTTVAASYSGAVRVTLYYDDITGQDCARVQLTEWMGNGKNRLIFEGPVDCSSGVVKD